MHYIIDGDCLLYRAGFACEKTTYEFAFNSGKKRSFPEHTLTQVKAELKDRGLTPADGKLLKIKTVEPLENACHLLKIMLNKLTNDESLSYTLVIGGKHSCFRYQVATITPYKGTRTAPRPTHLDGMKEYLVTRFNTVVAPDPLEADDYVGILAMSRKDSVVVAIDKDLRQIPRPFKHIVTGEVEHLTDPGYVKLDGKKLVGGGITWLWAQCLLGDYSDNIPGLKGYGPKTIAKLFADQDARQVTADAYFKVCSNFEKLAEVMELLYIRRYENDTFVEEQKQWLAEELQRKRSSLDQLRQKVCEAKQK